MPQPRRGESRQDFVGRCMGSAEAQASFPEVDQRLAFCYSTYDNRRRANQLLQLASVTTATCAARRVTFLGRQFRVVPAVLVRAQVLRNNLGATFLPAEEITDEWAEQWNGIPVLVGPHPSERGISSSGRTPEIINARGVGWIFGARAEAGQDGTRRLVGEVWLDEGRANVVEGFQAVLQALDANQSVELSTGFPTNSDEQQGVHNGEAYELVLHPAGADHLVISTEMTGACAVADGCGLGANEKEKPMAGEAAAAGAANDAPAVPAAVSAPPAPAAPKVSGIGKLLGKVAELFGGGEARAFSWEDHEAARLKRELEAAQQSMSDDERRQKLKESLQAQFGGPDREVIVTDTFSDEHFVVFWFSTPMGPQPKGAEYYRADYTEAANGAMTFSEPTRVRRVTKYEPVAATAPATQSHTEGDHMADDKKEQTDVLAAVANLAKQVEQLAGKVETLATAGAPAEIAGLKRSIAELAGKFEKMETVTSAAINERERERQQLVTDLAGNFRVPFTAAELESKPIEELRKLAELAKPENFSARGGPQGSRAEQRFAEPTKYWEKPKKEGD